MTIVPDEFNTRIALLKRVQPELVEIHYKSGCVFTTEDVADVQIARFKMMGARPYATLTIIPEDVEFTLENIRVDHTAPERGMGRVTATAIVARSVMIERITHIYFNHFPQLQQVLITQDEGEARKWVQVQLKELGLTGS